MKRNLVLLTVISLFGFAATAWPQATYQLTGVPTFVNGAAQVPSKTSPPVGRSENLGAIRFTQTNAVVTLSSSIQVQYLGVQCDNSDDEGGGTAGTGPIFTFNGGGFATVAATSVVNLGSGCVITINTPAGIGGAVGDFFELEGVRGRIDLTGLPDATDIQASVNATPANSSLFVAPTVFRISTTQHSYNLSITTATQLLCLPLTAAPTLTITEGFPGAFVQNVTFQGHVAVKPRLDDLTHLLGCGVDAEANCQNTAFTITVTPGPGVMLSWPLKSTADPNTGAYLNRTTSISPTATTQVYEFISDVNAGGQGFSDLNTETFSITPSVTAIPSSIPTPPNTTFVSVSETPPLSIPPDPIAATPVTQPFGTNQPKAEQFMPRFNDPEPKNPILTVAACTTNILFPFVANVAGYDTGIAIANTSTDPYGTLPQLGTCALNGFPIASPADSNATPPAPILFTTPTIQSGDTFTMILSGSSVAGQKVFNGFEGYIIAVCNFQYGHAFAFISTPFPTPGTGPDAAQGYLALIIPDPTQYGFRLAQTTADFDIGNLGFAASGPPSGEALGQ